MNTLDIEKLNPLFISSLAAAVATYFEDADHLKEFEEWKRKRNETSNVLS